MGYSTPPIHPAPFSLSFFFFFFLFPISVSKMSAFWTIGTKTEWAMGGIDWIGLSTHFSSCALALFQDQNMNNSPRPASPCVPLVFFVQLNSHGNHSTFLFAVRAQALLLYFCHCQRSQMGQILKKKCSRPCAISPPHNSSQRWSQQKKKTRISSDVCLGQSCMKTMLL